MASAFEGWPGINEAKKYVASNTLTKLGWQNTIFLKGAVHEEIRKLKQEGRPDLVDEFKLKMFPVTLGTGKHLFVEGTIPAAFKLSEKPLITSSGVIFANYKRAGEVKTRSFE